MAAMRGVKTLVASLAVAPSCTGFRTSGKSKRRDLDEYTIYEGKPLMDITTCNKAEMDMLAKLVETGDCRLLQDEDLSLGIDGSCVESPVICSASAADTLSKGLGLAAARVVSKDAAEYFRVTSGSVEAFFGEQSVGDANDAFYTNWRDYPTRLARMNEIVAASNGAAKLVKIGTTIQGRDITVVRMTGAGWVKGGPRLVVTGNIHAREWIGGMATLYAVEQLAVRAGNDQSFLAGIQVDVVPITNPDGFVYSTAGDRFHRKNMRWGLLCKGVDNNRNFNITWGALGSSTNQCMDNYQGSAPNSEPETIAVIDLMKESPMTVYVDIHAFSQLILHPYGYSSFDHPRKPEYDAVGGLMQKAIEGKFGTHYTLGAVGAILYGASGSTIDFASKLGALGFCYELRPGKEAGKAGFAPPVSEILPTAQECYEGLLATVKFVKSKAR